MITQRMIGQFGNQCIQYFAARIMADVTGLAYVPPPCFVDKRGHPVKWTDDAPLFEMQAVEGRRHKGEPHRIRAQHTFDPETLDCCPDAPIYIEHGYFQSYAFLKPYKQQIRDEWLPWLKPPAETDPDAVYIHCRRADYVPGVENPNRPDLHCLAMTMDEIGRCLREFPDAKSLVICTDDPRDPFIGKFAQFDMPWKVSGLAWDEDFRLLASARNWQPLRRPRKPRIVVGSNCLRLQ